MTLRDFFVGSTIINLPLCYLDVCIGAGAKHVDHNSPGMVAAFVAVVLSFLGLIAFIGVRAKKKLERFEEEDKRLEQTSLPHRGHQADQQQRSGSSSGKPRSNSMARYEETAPARGGRGGRGERKLNDLLDGIEDGDEEGAAILGAAAMAEEHAAEGPHSLGGGAEQTDEVSSSATE